MKQLFKRVKASFRYYYYKQKNDWHFPSNMAHSTGSRIAAGTYEPRVSEVMAAHLEEDSIFIDVGANVGYFSNLAAGIVAGKGAVYAFEPDFENYYALTKNILDHTNVYALNMALSDDTSFALMNHSSHSSCHSMVSTGNYLDGVQFPVPTLTLDRFWETYLHKQRVGLLKVDVEGAELKVLEGMEKLISEKMVNTMIIEFCPAIIRNAGFEVDDFYMALAPHFSISVIDESYRQLLDNGRVYSLSDFNRIADTLLEKEEALNINLLCEQK